MKKSFAFGMLLIIGSMAKSQLLVPEGRFLVDSIKIGESVPFVLTIDYPIEVEVIFPDSNFNFSPFEFVSKEYFASKTDSASVTDSVIYNITTFEIDVVQSLALPVFLITNGDSTSIYSKVDSIYLLEMVPIMPDSIALREDIAFVDVSKAFNYPYLLIGIAITLVILGAAYLLFGKKIKQKIELYRLERAYKKFSADFDLMYGNLRNNGDRSLTEKLLILWKKYMEKLEDRPYTKLTSKEIASLSDAGKLSDALKVIDKSIYGKTKLDIVYKNFEQLEDVTIKRYQRKVGEIKNG